MTSDPEVTIAIPVYNGERLLPEAIESVLMQDLTGFELLIGDNASTDETPRIAQHYAQLDSRVRYLRHTENIGVTNNFFHLLANARGKFFSWLAHDDSYASRDHISKLAGRLRQGYVLAFPNANELHYSPDGRVEKTRENILGAFAAANTRFQMSRVAVHCAAHQIYGLFRIETLRLYQAILEEDRMIIFGEGRFVQKIIANERCVFVPDLFQNFGLEDRKKDRPTHIPFALIRDYPTYIRRLLAMYWRSPLTIPERLLIYAEVVRLHLPNFFLITAVISKRVLVRAIHNRLAVQ